jgi:hypothetical protein
MVERNLIVFGGKAVQIAKAWKNPEGWPTANPQF